MCHPATTLHTATCHRTDAYGCNALVSGSPKAGDAFDCDVNYDGTFDATTERFYYVKSEGNYTILIYSKNMNDQTMYAYDSSRQNWYGPRTAYQYLPSTSTWKNPGIIAPGTRNIVNDIGTKTTDNGNHTIESFTYTNKAARFLTYQEAISACGTEWIDYEGYLNHCTWLMESLGQYETMDGAYGYWLEGPHYEDSYNAGLVRGYTRRISYGESNVTGSRGVRPVITILTASITN